MTPMERTLMMMMVMNAFLHTYGAGQTPSEGHTTVLYPKLAGVVKILCECPSKTCKEAFWFHVSLRDHSLQFLVSRNIASRSTYRDGVDINRFKVQMSNSEGSTLSITNVTESDEGIYSCILKDLKQELWNPGTLVLPGVTPPTAAPVTVRPQKTPCRCRNRRPDGGCESMVLWPLVGVLLGLAVTLITTVYYFSRLPKKCHHHFTKKRRGI